jgi:hypothetical protein
MFLAALVVLLVVSSLAPPAELGLSVQSSKDGYLFAGGTQPWLIALALLILGLYLLLMYAEPTEPGKPFPGVFRRLVAFWLDFIFAMAAFQWTFIAENAPGLCRYHN